MIPGNALPALSEAAFVILIPKVRFDVVLGDIERGGVGQSAFYTITCRDEHFSILNKNK